MGRDEFLRQIDGITFGEDPRQGFFEGSTFYHPDMRFQLQFPEGWKTQNTPSAVVALSPKQDAIIQLGLAGTTPPREAASKFLSQEGVRAGQSSTGNINGNPSATSYFQAQTEQGVIEGLVSFISYGGRTFGLMGYTPQGNLGNYDGALRSSINSFDRLRNSAALEVKPAKIELVKLTREMTLAQFNEQYPSTTGMTELAIINELEGPESVIPRGRVVKRVVGGGRRRSRGRNSRAGLSSRAERGIFSKRSRSLAALGMTVASRAVATAAVRYCRAPRRSGRRS